MITYDDVAEWWENSEWNMSTYPPSAWHDYAVQEGLSLEELSDNAEHLEAYVGELYENSEPPE
jgi:hypothetical protein